jgi:hypothetical protein
LYDVGPDYLVMEYIEGPTLAARIAAGAIPLVSVADSKDFRHRGPEFLFPCPNLDQRC